MQDTEVTHKLSLHWQYLSRCKLPLSMLKLYGSYLSSLSSFYILYVLSPSMYVALSPPYGLAEVPPSPVGYLAPSTLTLILPMVQPGLCLIQPAPIIYPKFSTSSLLNTLTMKAEGSSKTSVNIHQTKTSQKTANFIMLLYLNTVQTCL